MNPTCEAAIAALQKHIDAKTGASAYAGGDGLAYLAWPESKRKAVAEFNARKYIIRYFADGGEKAGNANDLLKAVHYLLMEWEAAQLAESKQEPEALWMCNLFAKGTKWQLIRTFESGYGIMKGEFKVVEKGVEDFEGPHLGARAIISLDHMTQITA